MFWTQSLLMDKVFKKETGSGTSDKTLFRLRNKLAKISFLVIYYLTQLDGVIWSGFWVTPKIAPANLCKTIHDIINYTTFICPFESGKESVERKGKITKIWISWERTEIFRRNKKTFFIVFERLTFGENIKIW